MAQEWYVCKNEVITGPYTEDALKKEILLGNVDDSYYLWKNGQKDWVPITTSKIWNNLGKSKGGDIQDEGVEDNDLRRAKRIPIVTNVMALDGNVVKNFPCMDMSESGIFLISDNTNIYKIGTRLILKIQKSQDIHEPFQISGEVVRIVEKWPKGYAIKFISISDDNFKMIKSILQKKGG